MRSNPYVWLSLLCCLFGCGGGGGGGTGVAVQVTPGSPTVPLSGVKKFSASVSGASDTSVTWSLREANGGIIFADGSYTAPVTAGIYHVIATSVADPTKTGTATVTVPVGIDIDPPSF